MTTWTPTGPLWRYFLMSTSPNDQCEVFLHYSLTPETCIAPGSIIISIGVIVLLLMMIQSFVRVLDVCKNSRNL
jgi:hypothetical protein